MRNIVTVMNWKIWKNQINDKHFWAFYYYCKDKGDIVKFKKKDNGKINLIINKK